MGSEGFAGASTVASVMVVGETLAARVEKPYDPEDKSELGAVAPVISVMELVDLLNPRQM